ncbi:MAG: UDP-N-acetylmuramoyl-L-alanine--D-glutamate ligase [Chloroflexi bacterium]|nr:UDP-N-acetylmuramoyl-L-alanine--D-glutamate ligase [Anaerolineaceae bacterium]NLI44539.1 UDP-N-acetylmuramoyl-L-alanine--D-glutamate ligase [Chloroflexota bacterium]HOE35692.1 UDP-N-acetylmuramoyl-L-alanine--D-glutamate ligase [Anaerolineaceae bacterium]HOT26007.1 UDP-N-acetylmuramoyl-L-alanine--D-glutamate ligase [Anaerolineaceae bacterium]HQH57381.1 UDP-N-acetylmuramoyl-L-alanine--D-glutamate ligase [Anaerolineaceae bacterium]
MKSWKDMKVIVLGAARQGTALSRYLAGQGARVILTDLRGPESLSADALALQDRGVELRLGGHPLEMLEGADMVCVSGGVPLTIPFLQEASRRGITLSNDSQVFMEACPAPIVGITGSAGKTTTTALLGLMARKYFEMKNSPRRAWVGGNIGNPLIDQVAEIHEDDLVILELSSFQLELMTVSPQVAVVLNITPNHLDRHGTMQAYTAAKARILHFQHQGDVAVLNRDDFGSWDLSSQLKSDLISFGFNRPEGTQYGTYIQKDSIWLQIDRQQLKMLPLDWIQLRGQHNISNVLAACAAAAAASLALPAIQSAVEEFTGVPHRLEFVRNVRGADWYNDSIATAPERTLAALESFQGPLILLLGGRDKDLPWDKLAAQVHSRVRHAVLFGEAAGLIGRALGTVQAGETLQSITECATLQEAVVKAAELAREGDTVLLSPGGTSYDAFKDFEERGEYFRQWVNAL